MMLAQSRFCGTAPAYGLFRADEFRVTSGECEDSAGIAQALWFFRHESIALPKHCTSAEFDSRLEALEDLRQWNARTLPGSARDHPALIWIGAPKVVEHALVDSGGEHLLTADGRIQLDLWPRLESNRSFYNADSRAFFSQRELRLRGRMEDGRFVARSIWPEDFRLDPAAPLRPIAATPAALREFVRREAQGGAQSAFATQPVWQRTPEAAQQRAGRPLIGLMLNGAQGDDDEAHGGHFGLFTGRVGAQGQMHDWLMANYYTLDSESEKGIIASMLPMEGYLADLNSGQSWYRPSYMLVATLHNERSAAHLSSALARMFKHFYRHQFSYQHATANCAGISISTLRTLGWNIPKTSPISWLKAIIGLPFVALKFASLRKGKAMFDYYTEEQTRLLPAIAFEQAGADLLRLVSGQLTRTLTTYEEWLQQDVEEILLVRIPQLPSSRVLGNCPVAGIDEFRQRVPKDPAQQQIIPLAPRPFPEYLKDPLAPKEKRPRSDYAIAAYSAGLLLLGGWLLRRLMPNRKSRKTDPGKTRNH